MENSHIEWTDHTFNPWIGCTKVSPGCAHCYAETLMDTRYGRVKWGKGNARSRTAEANWKQPVKWNREADGFHYSASRPIREMDAFGWRPHRPRVFCASLADWLDDEVPIEWLADLLALIRATPNLDWLLLTKRPQNWKIRLAQANGHLASVGNLDEVTTCPKLNLAFWIADWIDGKPPANVWVGTSVEDQTRGRERIQKLLDIPAAVRFISCEPLLGSLDLSIDGLWKSTCEQSAKEYIDSADDGKSHPAICRDQADRWMEARADAKNIDWVIVGGESGPAARPMHPNWARSLRDQCQAAGVAFLFKQWGEWAPVKQEGSLLSAVVAAHGAPNNPSWHTFNSGEQMVRLGKKFAGRLLDGREWNGFPSVHSVPSVVQTGSTP